MWETEADGRGRGKYNLFMMSSSCAHIMKKNENEYYNIYECHGNGRFL
jgi:hypothetical protein